jgi:uncharacterized iron-regulated membrane protein
MPNNLPLSRFLAAGFAFALLLAIAVTGVPQSGRRAPKSKAAPVATPEPTPAPVAQAEKPKAERTFMVAMDRFGDFAGIPLYTYSTVMRHCVERLNENGTVKAMAADREMTRGDAIKQARAEKESNLVWLQLRPDTVSGDTRGTSSLANVYLQYTVFAPTTAKIVANGQTYPHVYRTKGIIVRPNTSGVTDDYELTQAAREVAERILKTVH